MLNKRLKIILVLLVLLVTFLLVFSPHFNYRYPLHAYEWHHVENAERILDGSYDYTKTNYEIGYDFILAFLFTILKITNINTIFAYAFFPALFAFFASLMLFFFVRRISNYGIALLSMVFFASLPSNVNLLGLWFAVPLTLALGFMVLFFDNFVRGFENKKYFYYSAVFLVLLFMIHPPSGSVSYFVFLIYALFNKNKIKSNLKPLLVLLLIPLIPFFIASLTLHPMATLNNLIFEYEYTPFEPGFSNYFILFIYGYIPLLLALTGMYFLFKDSKFSGFKIFFVLFVLTFFLSTMFLLAILKFTILAQNQRLIYYYMLSLVPLSALGTERVAKSIKDKVNRKILSAITIFLFFFFIIFSTFYNYPRLWNGVQPYHIVEDESYNSLNELKGIDSNKTVLAPLSIGEAVYSISKNNAVASLYFIGNETLKKHVEVFFVTSNCPAVGCPDCELREYIAEKYNASYAVSKEPINCSFLELVSDKYLIYKVK